jgi:hypothetical protein
MMAYETDRFGPVKGGESTGTTASEPKSIRAVRG